MQLLQRGFRVLRDLLDEPERRLVLRVDQLLREPQLDPQSDQPLLASIVEVPLDPATLGVPAVRQARSRLAQLASLRLQFPVELRVRASTRASRRPTAHPTARATPIESTRSQPTPLPKATTTTEPTSTLNPTACAPRRPPTAVGRRKSATLARLPTRTRPPDVPRVNIPTVGNGLSP